TGQGVAEGKFPDAWSDTENVLWKVEVPGRGNSSPILWKDCIFLTTARDAKRRSILCFQRSDGKLLWEAFAPNTGGESTNGKNGFASGTPCTDGERVYAYLGSDGLLCVDFTGKQVWHHSFGTINTRHGSAGSPLLYREHVIIFQDQNVGSFVAALDRKTGDVV